MKKLPFKVSAKAARLIGRENVANADGAISELVKNTYDADASHCTICFLPRYSQTPEWISKNEYKWLVETHPNLQSAFCLSDDGGNLHANPSDLSGFVIKPDPDSSQRSDLEIALKSMKDLWIVDDGDGMSSTAIEENWMVIGTNFKELNIKSDSGRTRTGAKGIGRFALDRLGVECELFSSQLSKGAMYRSFLSWKVDWNAFEGQGKVLDQVEAELDDDEARFQSSIDNLSRLCQSQHLENKALLSFIEKRNGTAIKIGLLRDDWNYLAVNRLFKFLGTLVPPTSQRALNIQLLDADRSKEFGEIEMSTADQNCASWRSKSVPVRV